MKKVKVTIVSFLMVFGIFGMSVNSSYAGTVTSYIDSITVAFGGICCVKFVDDLTNPAGCIDNGNEDLLVFDAKTNAGVVMLSILLTAKAQGFRVNAAGSGDCLFWFFTDVEELVLVGIVP